MTTAIRTCAHPDGCPGPVLARDWCSKHYNRWRRHGDLDRVDNPPPPVHRGPSNHMWAGDEVSYRNAHRRVYRARGAASAHPCRYCGAQAKQWAYDHMDPNEKIGKNAKHVSPYSTDPARYIPLCVSCHRRFDLAMREG